MPRTGSRRKPLVFFALGGVVSLLVLRFASRWFRSVAWKPVRMAGLESALNAYPTAVVLLFGIGLGLILLGIPARTRPLLRCALAHSLLAWGGLVVSLIVCEGFAHISLSWQHRMPAFAAGLKRSGPSANPSIEDVNLMVVGESSAEGVPYRDWVSVGKIVTWRLRRLIPDRMFHVEIQARAGWTLEQMHQKLAEIKKAPDAIIVYAGHNEFASRYGWWSEVSYYDDDQPSGFLARLTARVSSVSPIRRLIDEAIQKERVAMRPPPSNRRIVDAPSFTPQQRDERLNDFRRRLDAIAAFCKQTGVLLVLVIPPGNDAGFEPNRSILPPETTRLERAEFARLVQEARAREAVVPIEQSITRYRELIARRPGFAEVHFRLARLLERQGDSRAAYREYVRARDLDGHPMRCPSTFQDVYREVAARYGAILVDGQEALRARNPAGQLDDRLFNDAFHPSFEGQVALAEAILEGLKARKAFDWPDSVPSPKLELQECASHFDVTRAAWRSAADFAAGFYRITMPIRFDDTERERKHERYARVVQALSEGKDPESLECPGIGVTPIQDRLKP